MKQKSDFDKLTKHLPKPKEISKYFKFKPNSQLISKFNNKILTVLKSTWILWNIPKLNLVYCETILIKKE
jgi:hypothetical protein